MAHRFHGLADAARRESGPLVGQSEALPADVAESIARCAEAVSDLARLRDELHVLRLSSDPHAQFATSLFDLERARRGDQEARAAMLDVADALLVFWREGTGAELSQVNPVLGELWASAASLLASFEVKRFEKALNECWEAREDSSRLLLAIEALEPEGNRRVEFARCLYHLELARLFVDSSRGEFAKRVALLSEAYHHPDVASELVGQDAGLQHLWREVLPYLDEFFEHLEEQAARKAGQGRPRSEMKTDPLLAAPEPVPPALGEQREVPSFRTLTRTPPVPQRALSLADLRRPAEPDADDIEVIEPVDAPPPPPPPDTTPPGGWRPPRPPPDSDIEILEAVEVVVPPPPPPPTLTPAHGIPAPDVELDTSDFDETPSAATLAFWDHAFDQLGLVPKSGERSARLLSSESRADRKRLSTFVESLSPHLAVPEARAFACLTRLLLAGQTREKSLFGQPNPRRKEALAQALPYLAASATSAGHAAVWFDLDGPETREALSRGLDLLMNYLAWCHREQVDPLDRSAIKRFTQV